MSALRIYMHTYTHPHGPCVTALSVDLPHADGIVPAAAEQNPAVRRQAQGTHPVVMCLWRGAERRSVRASITAENPYAKRVEGRRKNPLLLW